MSQRRGIPDETKATIRVLKNTTHLTLEEIALRCNISKTSVQRITSAKDKVPENERRFCGRKKKLTPEQEALILRSIAELRSRGFFFFTASDGADRNSSCHRSNS